MKFITYSPRTFPETSWYRQLPGQDRYAFDVLTQVFHFKANSFVLENLTDWYRVSDDPIYRILFPGREMLDEMDFRFLGGMGEKGLPEATRQKIFKGLRRKIGPKRIAAPGSVPQDELGRPLLGTYSYFLTLVSLFPDPMVHTWHSYCSNCFRWNAFDNREAQQSSSYTDPLTPILWIKAHSEVTDVLFTGADPLVVKASNLWKFFEPVIESESVLVTRISSKSLTWWPFRFTTDADADLLLRLFEKIIASSKHLNFCTHFTHPRELEHPEVAKAVKRIPNTGAVIRTQGPLIRGVNDRAEDWAEMWTRQIKIGMIPYCIFNEAEHDPPNCFRVPPAEALTIFQDAPKITPGLASTVRGSVFMYYLNRLLVDGTTTVNGPKYFVLKILQAPPGCDSEGDLKLVSYDEKAIDLGNLYELFNGPAAYPLGRVNVNENEEILLTRCCA